jgi:lipopolysaccharide/colanic/teichoic acid biosynthesis glycosyltransferase
MSVNAKVEAVEIQKNKAQTAYPTVRESIDKKLHSLEEPLKVESIYKIQYGFEGLAKKDKIAKTVIDVLFGVLALISFIVLYPAIALGIKMSSYGPVIYKQVRTGLSGREFVCYKFRTMHQINLRRIDGKPIITQKGDRRVFWLGNFMRKTSLDELPQIINVIKGDMSLIGPRPYPVRECSYWNNRFDDFYYRYAVKPGISGLAQINGFRGGTLDEEHMRRRLDYDLNYVEKCSLSTDLNIIAKTVKQIVSPHANAH